MLTKPYRAGAGTRRLARQSGVVLVIALIILVALTMAAVALVRSVDTSNIIAGNLAFQQAATRSADAGIEDAISWLNDCNNTHVTCAATALDADEVTRGYSAGGAGNNPAANQTWDDYWTNVVAGRGFYSLAQDTAGNTVSYIIDRMCNGAGSKTGGASCVASPAVTAATGNAEEGGEIQLNAPSVVYYRITARVAGPRNTVSYVQALISM